MMYAIMTSKGFQMRGSEAAIYTTQEKAAKFMAPGDTLVPVESDAVKFGARNKEQTDEHTRLSMLGVQSASEGS